MLVVFQSNYTDSKARSFNDNHKRPLLIFIGTIKVIANKINQNLCPAVAFVTIFWKTDNLESKWKQPSAPSYFLKFYKQEEIKKRRCTSSPWWMLNLGPLEQQLSMLTTKPFHNPIKIALCSILLSIGFL